MLRASVSLFDYRPQYCPFGHQLWPGIAQVGTLLLHACPAVLLRGVVIRSVSLGRQPRVSYGGEVS